jgi:hypothetical protein
MSALGHKRTFATQKAMSALPPIADIGCCRCRSEPIADIDSITSSARVGPLFARPQKDQKLWILWNTNWPFCI